MDAIMMECWTRTASGATKDCKSPRASRKDSQREKEKMRSQETRSALSYMWSTRTMSTKKTRFTKVD